MAFLLKRERCDYIDACVPLGVSITRAGSEQPAASRGQEALRNLAEHPTTVSSSYEVNLFD
jgi:hypothetical protein